MVQAAKPIRPRRPITPLIVGGFYFLACAICSAAAASLLLPGPAFEWMWAIKRPAYQQLLAMAPWSGFGFAALAIAMALTSVGCFQAKRWGWVMAVAIFAVNGVADGARLFAGEVLEGLIGVVTAGAILYALSRPKMRDAFDK